MPVFHRMRSSSLFLFVALVALLSWNFVHAQTSGEEQMEQGASIYAANCAVCHGDDGQGRVGATLAKDWPSIRPDLEVRATIENGIAGSPMPAWSQKNGGPLTDEDIDALVVYILSWETGGPRVFPPTPTYIPRPLISPVPDVVGDPNQGAILYDQNCAVCHGTEGRGRVGTGLDKVWPSIRPDLGIKNTISNGVMGSPMPAWSQVNGGPLTETEINNLVAFIMALEPASEEIQQAPTPAPAPGPLADWFGILLAVVLFILVVWIAIVLQTRAQAQNDTEK